jgi:hypothetical protein
VYIFWLLGAFLTASSAWASQRGAGEKKSVSPPAPRVNLTLPRYNLHEALAAIGKQHKVTILCDSYFHPRKNIAAFNKLKQPLVLRNLTLEQAFNQLARLFDYQWSKEKDAYIFKNRVPTLDAGYEVDEKTLDLVMQNPPDGTFKFLARFLDLSEKPLLSLAEQHPQFELLLPQSPRRAEVEFYARLSDALCTRLDKGEKVKYSELPPDIRERALTAAQQNNKNLNPSDVEKFVYQLVKDKNGGQRLQTTGLPNKR